MKKQHLPLFILIVGLVSACVPGKKYEELLAKQQACESELASYKDKAESSMAKLKDVEEELTMLREDNSVLREDTAFLGRKYRLLNMTNENLNDLYKQTQEQLMLQKGFAQTESQKLSAELQAKELELIKREKELIALEDELNAKTNLLVEREKRVNELEDLLKSKDEVVEALMAKVSKALLGFKDKGLTIEERNGKVYVKMEAKLLFASGSTVVGSEGKKALVELAKVLEDQHDMEVVVEGHTDKAKLNSSNYPHNNWELSVLRSTAVVEIMLANSKMDPKILAASGRGEYLPVGEDMAKNRRIEIILTPNLDELFKIINKE